ncbi:hypothetical protein CsSME_00022380 [Camellia sinensis var. sinensis]
MAASIISSAVVAPAQASMVAPFTGLKSTSAFPVTRKLDTDITSLASNGGRVQCMKVWPPLGLKKFETLSYLPPLPLVFSLDRWLCFSVKDFAIVAFHFHFVFGYIGSECYE